MLSRIAESLFWIGRYVERADGTARLLDVHQAVGRGFGFGDAAEEDEGGDQGGQQAIFNGSGTRFVVDEFLNLIFHDHGLQIKMDELQAAWICSRCALCGQRELTRNSFATVRFFDHRGLTLRIGQR
mgnify:CR=1 FL=1